MEKKLKSLALVLFSICCAIGFSTTASALEMTGDMNASDITVEDGMVIDGKGEYTITGGLSITDGADITIKNVTLSGNGTQDILLNLSNAGDVVIENVIFTNFIKTGIYAEQFASLSVTKSTFDGIDTDKLKDQSYPGNPEEELIKRSPASIDLNLGNNGKEINVNTIIISDNTFKNLKIADEYLADSTGGAIKIKVKDVTNLKNIGTITIQNNTFTDNARDLVIGTDSPGNNTTQDNTGDLEVLLVNNGSMVVKNNSGDGATETLNGNYKLNYADDKKYELDDNLYYIINDENYADFENVVDGVMADNDIKGLAFSIEGLSFAIAKETFEDENLGEALEDLSNITPTEETTVEALKQYQGEGVVFMDVAGLDIFEDGIHFNTNLGKEFDGKLYVYYYDEANGLQLVSNPDAEAGAVEFSFTKNGHYVISVNDLLASLPSEEVPEVPQTFDAVGVYAGIGVISVLGIAGAVIYLKRRNA